MSLASAENTTYDPDRGEYRSERFIYRFPADSPAARDILLIDSRLNAVYATVIKVLEIAESEAGLGKELKQCVFAHEPFTDQDVRQRPACAACNFLRGAELVFGTQPALN